MYPDERFMNHRVFTPEELAAYEAAIREDERKCSEPVAWIRAAIELPAVGQKVILFSNGVVQQEIYFLDAYDPSDLHITYLWAREDLDKGIPISKEDRAFTNLSTVPTTIPREGIAG